MASVIKVTIFIKDMEQFAKINAVYSTFFNDHKPARSCVEVRSLSLSFSFPYHPPCLLTLPLPSPLCYRSLDSPWTSSSKSRPLPQNSNLSCPLNLAPKMLPRAPVLCPPLPPSSIYRSCSMPPTVLKQRSLVSWCPTPSAVLLLLLLLDALSLLLLPFFSFCYLEGILPNTQTLSNEI